MLNCIIHFHPVEIKFRFLPYIIIAIKAKVVKPDKQLLAGFSSLLKEYRKGLHPHNETKNSQPTNPTGQCIAGYQQPTAKGN